MTQPPSNVNSAKVLQIIEVRSTTGSGTLADPTRRIVEYFSLEGELLARQDLDLVEARRDKTIWPGEVRVR